MRNAWNAAGVVLVVAMASVMVSAGAAPRTSTPALRVDSQLVTPNPQAADCINKNEIGEAYWDGDASPELLRAAEGLSTFVHENPDVATGVAYCSDRTGILLFVPEVTSAVEQAVRDAQRELNDETETVDVVLAAAPLAPLQEAVDTLPGELLDEAGIISLGVDVITGGVTLRTASTGALESDAMARVLAEIESIDSDIPVLVEEEVGSAPVTFGTDRRNDVAPWNSSTEWTTSNGAVCSLGLPVTVAGTRMNMTAAHCTGSSGTHPASGASVGTQYTTTWTGTLDTYGDWKLLHNSTYANRVFSGAISGPTKSNWLPLVGINWAPLSLGSGLCTSGRTTGQICRYWVSGTTLRRNIEGHWVRHLVWLRHDGTPPYSGADSGGFRAGDSGGPCYYSNGSGGMMGAGTVSAGNGDSGGYLFYCAQVSGLKAWAPGAFF